MFMDIGTEVTFAASHFLPDHPKCGKMHGHTWRVEVDYVNVVTPEGILYTPPSGMLVDFGRIKSLIQDQFDHGECGVLNDFMAMPTAENIAIYILKLMPEIWGYCYTLEVTVWESEVSYASASMELDFTQENGHA